MSEAAIIFLLILCIILLFSIILYQRFHFKKGIHARLKEVSDKLEDILVSGSDEKVMVFTDDSALIELSGQINLLLEGYQKIKVDYRRSQAASKKMLSNISHDIKTPMTVILGYLEMIRLESPEENELLEKVEEKARKMMELISQFFTLAKLEAGDTSLELSSVSLNECCREAVLDFYELLTQKNFQVEVDIPEQSVCIMDGFWKISYQMPSVMAETANIWEFFFIRTKNMSISTYPTRAKVSTKPFPPGFSTVSSPWRIPGTRKYRVTDSA